MKRPHTRSGSSDRWRWRRCYGSALIGRAGPSGRSQQAELDRFDEPLAVASPHQGPRHLAPAVVARHFDHEHGPGAGSLRFGQNLRAGPAKIGMHDLDAAGIICRTTGLQGGSARGTPQLRHPVEIAVRDRAHELIHGARRARIGIDRTAAPTTAGGQQGQTDDCQNSHGVLSGDSSGETKRR